MLARLLTVAMLLSLCSALAQSQPDRNSGAAVVSNRAEWTDPSRTSTADAKPPELRAHEFTTEWRLPSDVTCYSIRSYLVVRDSPHSDVTHRDGHTTCVPAARIRMYSTVDRGPEDHGN